jgi:hypothetical protein
VVSGFNNFVVSVVDDVPVDSKVYFVNLEDVSVWTPKGEEFALMNVYA